MKQFVHISLVAVLGVAPLVLAQTEGPITQEGRYWVRTISGIVTPITLERFRLDTIGNVVVRGSNGDKATFQLKARVRAKDAREAEAMFREFDATPRFQGGWFRMKITAPTQTAEAPELVMFVPRSLQQVLIETRAGNVQAQDLDGDVEVHSAAGQIAVDGIKGNAGIRTGGGDIQIGSVGGGVRCYSGAGVIRVQSTGAESWFDTAGGEIFVHQAAGPVHAATAGGNIHIDRTSGAVFARTAAGLIEVQQADGVVTAESSGGAIQVNAAKGVRCDSSGGAIRLRNVTGPLRASTAMGSILAELLSGNHIQDSTLSTNAGDVTVLISSKIPLTVQARNESAAGRIVSEFPEIPSRGGQIGFTPVVAQGAINGGGPVLRIVVVDGTIYLRRQK